MKKLTILSTAVFLTISFSINAQHQHSERLDNSGQSSMKHKGMMGMMKSMDCPMCGKIMQHTMPMQQYMMLVKMLPNMQDALSLTSEQTVNFIDMQTEFKKQQIEFYAELRKNRMKLQSTLDEKASSEKIRKQMQVCSEIKINMRLAAYETANKMKAELTEEQKSALTDMMNNYSGMMQGDGMMPGGSLMHNRMNQ